MNLPYIQLRFKIAPSSYVGRYFPEALFRGAFGNVLKRLVCINKKESCENCFLSKNCSFAVLFFPDKIIERFHNIKNPPPPYNFFFIKNKDKESLDFDFILLKDGFNYITHIIFTFIRMGEISIGRDKYGYKIESITDMSNGNNIFDIDNNQLTNPNICKFSFDINQKQSKDKLKIDFISPLRLKKDNDWNKDISFYDIVKALLLRFSLLAECYGEYDKEFDHSSFLENAKKVTKIDENMHITNRKRYSTTQEHKINMGGVKGSITFEGENIGFYENILRFGELFGIGKNTTFGCGRYMLVESLKVKS